MTAEEKENITNILSNGTDESIELGLIIGFNSVGINEDEIYSALLDNKSLLDRNQDEICEMCEISIIGMSSNSQNYQCEGRFCEEANDLFIDEFVNDRI